MEFKYIKKKSKKNVKPFYQVTMSFMIGDADSFENEVVKFGTTDEDIKTLKNLILALEKCEHYYKNGKGGYDGYSGIPEYDAFFNSELDIHNYEDFLGDKINTLSYDDCEKLVINDILNKINPIKLKINHPTCYQGTISSFDGYQIRHKDESGVFSKVNPVFTKEEKITIGKN